MKGFKATALILLILLGALFIYVVEDIPDFGDPHSPSIRAVELFDLPANPSENVLDQGRIPDELTDALKKRGLPLPSRIEKIADKEGQWNAFIPKEEAHYPKEEKYYWVSKAGDQLRIYRYAFVVRWFEKGLKETGVPNMVTHGLADYRSYDTLGEAIVIFTAGVSVILLLRRRGKL
jgi:multicomponent Na+:H+ antiporter subunit B